MKKRIKPKAGQESVWDYPRPPRLEKTDKHIVVEIGGRRIVDTHNAFRVLETSHPPVYYIPPDDIDMRHLRRHKGKTTHCEFKGMAQYWDIIFGDEVRRSVAWSYPEPSSRFRSIAGYLAFYPSRADACYVNGERVKAQAGDFYGGWITSEIVGPFKGGAGTWGW